MYDLPHALLNETWVFKKLEKLKEISDMLEINGKVLIRPSKTKF